MIMTLHLCNLFNEFLRGFREIYRVGMLSRPLFLVKRAITLSIREWRIECVLLLAKNSRRPFSTPMSASFVSLPFNRYKKQARHSFLYTRSKLLHSTWKEKREESNSEGT